MKSRRDDGADIQRTQQVSANDDERGCDLGRTKSKLMRARPRRVIKLIAMRDCNFMHSRMYVHMQRRK